MILFNAFFCLYAHVLAHAPTLFCLCASDFFLFLRRFSTARFVNYFFLAGLPYNNPNPLCLCSGFTHTALLQNDTLVPSPCWTLMRPDTGTGLGQPTLLIQATPGCPQQPVKWILAAAAAGISVDRLILGPLMWVNGLSVYRWNGVREQSVNVWEMRWMTLAGDKNFSWLSEAFTQQKGVAKNKHSWTEWQHYLKVTVKIWDPGLVMRCTSDNEMCLRDKK